MPEWYKNLESYVGGEKKPNGQARTAGTAKRCMPIFDAISSGYLITTHVDVWVSQKINEETGTNAPYFEYDPTSDKLILNADILGYNSSLTNPIELYFNQIFFNWISSFDAFFYGSNQLNGLNYKLNIYSFTNNGNIYTVGNPYDPSSTVINYIQCYQEFSTISISANPISSLVFTTSQIPINGTLISKPLIFNSDVSLTNNSGSNLINIITDITAQGFEWKPSLLYAPQYFRYVSMTSTEPLRSYDFQIYLKYHNGEIKLFKLSSGQCCSLKIGFIKKDSIKL
jgi:hypothetical protein